MIETLRNAWKIPELRKKIIFTLFILLIYRVGNVIPVPYIDTVTLGSYFDSVLSNTIFGLYNAMSGSAFSQATVFALGIQPYINSSIIIQLLTVAIPALERLAKDGGEEGKKKINMITRYATVGLGLLMGWAYYMMLVNYENQYNISIITQHGFLPGLVIVLAFTAGSAMVMWLGEQISEFGIGNGISMILFANIISSIPSMVGTLFTMTWWQIIIVLVGMAALLLFIIFINDAERRIPIQYAKRVVGRKVYGGQNTNLPIKVAMSGVMPVIFAQSICSMPATICAFMGITPQSGNWWYNNMFSSSSWFYAVIYFLMIFFFSWFYSTIQYDTVEIANNLKSNGGFIPGFRPGKPTAEFIQKVINKIIVFGAVYLGIVALLPIVAGNLMESVKNLAIGGTSVIIVVGVALETVKALEAQMLMRHYKGFLD
ncbi:MAG: preprotein translocase subunit SecY [Oscillospiraceae bacterium]|nr:preprotein translocase subunit SecY [Oscillospiraceae bacterium]